MTKLCAHWRTLLLALLLAAGVRAEVVEDLYFGQVPVADRSQQVLSRAARQALSQVLVKVSGSGDVLTLPEVAASLDGAMTRVQQFSYARTSDPEQPLVARFEFDPRWVTGLLSEAGAPVWTANRPEVLVWLVQEGPAGKQFVTHENAPELVARLEEGFARRGVPLRFPLFDLADTAALSAEQAWHLNSAVLRQASSRYRVGEVLAGRMTRLSTGKWTGDWAYLSAQGRIDRSAAPESVSEFLDGGVALVAEEMAGRYAVAAVRLQGDGVPMLVQNVRSYADYAAILSWLEGLELVERADVDAIQGDRLSLRLQAQADAGRLASIVELNRRLVPVPSIDPDTGLSYQWRQ